MHIENRTGQGVREVRIEHEDGALTHRGAWSKSITVPFLPRGDSSYRLFAVLEDGSTVGGAGARYVEPGSEHHEVLVANAGGSSGPVANRPPEPALDGRAARL
ncbi:hypothetical protein H1235_06640 [Pseudoxanthomonas sp. NC8]|nr:hypothetical protein H1235_06640 [Pseudoxanthomonas sp. NC8]